MYFGSFVSSRTAPSSLGGRSREGAQVTGGRSSFSVGSGRCRIVIFSRWSGGEIICSCFSSPIGSSGIRRAAIWGGAELLLLTWPAGALTGRPRSSRAEAEGSGFDSSVGGTRDTGIFSTAG